MDIAALTVLYLSRMLCVPKFDMPSLAFPKVRYQLIDSFCKRPDGLKKMTQWFRSVSVFT